MAEILKNFVKKTRPKSNDIEKSLSEALAKLVDMQDKMKFLNKNENKALAILSEYKPLQSILNNMVENTKYTKNNYDKRLQKMFHDLCGSVGVQMQRKQIEKMLRNAKSFNNNEDWL